MVFIYILKLANGRYYIGKSKEPFKRITKHFTEGGSSWTRRFKPEEIHSVVPDCSDFDEDKYVYQMMSEFGINNVRGGSYSEVYLSPQQIAAINKILKSTNDVCLVCGAYDHFADRCPIKNIQRETDNLELNPEINHGDDKRYPGNTCYACGSVDHISNNCPTIRCMICGEFGHKSKVCRSVKH